MLVVGCNQAAEPVTLTGVSWAEEGLPGLILEFQGGLPDLQATVGDSGLEVWLPDTLANTTTPKGVQMVAQAGGTRIVLSNGSGRLVGVELQGRTVKLTLAGLAVSASDYRLGVGDVISVQVFREPANSGDFPILQDGTIHVPMSNPVPAAGLTENELARRIEKALAEFLVEPQVSVAVRQYQSQHVAVMGDVSRAARVALRPGMTIEDVLSEAGAALSGGRKVRLTRTSGEDAVVLSADDLDDPATPRPRDGDVLTVMEPYYVYIRGEVREPGEILYREGMTLQQVIAKAKGLTDWASRKDIRIQRTVDGEEVDLSVNLKRIEERRDEDPELRPGDLIVVRRRVL